MKLLSSKEAEDFEVAFRSPIIFIEGGSLLLASEVVSLDLELLSDST